MKGILFVLFIGTGLSLSAQTASAVSTEFITPAELAYHLTSSYKTDREKVTAIFRWITDNIAYNVRSVSRNKIPVIYEEPDDSLPVLKPLGERVAETVLRRRRAVCDGYSRLFKSLCNHAGLASEIVTGYARVNWDRAKSKFRSNHRWNTVYIDSAWYLLDVTWASGFITYRGDEFIRDYDARYFLTPPEQFIRDHYPEDMAWALLNKPPVVAEFYYSPFRYSGYVTSGIISYYPDRGMLDASLGDSIRFELETFGNKKNVYVTDMLPDENNDCEDPDEVIRGNRKMRCTYNVTNAAAEWLYLVCDGDVVLRYKLNIKRNDNRTADNTSK